MSENVGGSNELAAQIINKYKEMYKTAGGNNADSISDNEIASIFQKDLLDGKIDGKSKDDKNNPVELIADFEQKVSADDVKALESAVAELAGQIQSDRTGGANPRGSVNGNGSLSNQGSVGAGGSANTNGSTHSASNGSYNENDYWSMQNYIISKQSSNNVTADKANEKFEAFQKDKDTMSFADLAKKYQNDERFKIFDKMTKTDYVKANITSEEQRQAYIINRMSNALRLDVATGEGKVTEIEVPSIKPKLSDEEKQLAQDIASGKISGQGWAADPKHPFHSLDAKRINYIMNEATLIKHGRTSEDEPESKPADKPEDASAGNVGGQGSLSGNGSVSGKGSTVDPTKANDKSAKHGIPNFENMTKAEKKVALRAREKELKEQIKAAKEKLKANPDDRDAILEKERLEDEKNKAHQALRTIQPALFGRVMSVLNPLLGLTGVFGGALGLASNIVDTVKDVNSGLTNITKLTKIK